MEKEIGNAYDTLAQLYNANCDKIPKIKKNHQHALKYYRLASKYGLAVEGKIADVLYQQGQFAEAQKSYSQVKSPDRDTLVAFHTLCHSLELDGFGC